MCKKTKFLSEKNTPVQPGWASVKEAVTKLYIQDNGQNPENYDEGASKGIGFLGGRFGAMSERQILQNLSNELSREVSKAAGTHHPSAQLGTSRAGSL